MLLATNEVGRTQWIAKWKPAQRDYLESKVAEFTRLSLSERELRLQTLELRWYLPKLMNLNSAERTARLAQMPERERALLEPKLRTWDIQPPEVRQDLLDYQEAISIIMFPGGAANENVLRGLPQDRQEALQKQFEHLNQLPGDRRERVLADFNLYFNFSPAEKIKALKKLSGTEQARLQQTIAPFE